MKTCYQCDKEVHWLAPDSRCGDCTRLTPEQVRGEEPMPEEAENALHAFCTKYDLKEEDFDEEDMDIYVGLYKGKRVRLNILLDEDFTAYDLFVEGVSVAYSKTSTDTEVLNFLYKSEKSLGNIN